MIKSLGENFLPAFFPVFFSLGQGEKYTGKKLADAQSMKIQVKPEEIPIHKNVGKICKT